MRLVADPESPLRFEFKNMVEEFDKRAHVGDGFRDESISSVIATVHELNYALLNNTRFVRLRKGHQYSR